ncbi:competence/damage-inducible protein A [Tundrisphaera sp. TA3]|uniref:competence/damage-inducible protein A n=1 Tax=Tundrisphaera sp. TA3 TaxID=3435775 RepID=UPI003EC087F2
MKAEIIAIGSELVSGQSLDTNSQWLCQRLGELGISVHYITALGDDLAENVGVFLAAIARADLVITGGGLGPTQDDLTREALASAAGVTLVEDAASLEAIRTMFARRNRVMAERNRIQALLPAGATPLPNAIGTAPGMAMEIDGTLVACLPGVPRELKQMFFDQVVPLLRRTGRISRTIVHRKINMFGKGESEIEADALDLTARGRVPEVGITASDATIAFRVIAEGATEAEAVALMEPTVAEIYRRFGDLIVGEGADDVVDGLVRELKRADLTIATAESCTGGMIAEKLTSVPGVSRYYPGSIVSYSNQAKAQVLGVPTSLLIEHGAVSAEVAAAMAEQVRERFGSDIGVSVTGYASPGEGVPPESVGLVYLGIATSEKVQTRKIEVGPEQPREIIRRRATKQALNWARLTIRHLSNRSDT